MVLTNFTLHEITDAKLRDELNGKLAIDDEFTQTKPNVWIADFEADGVRYQAGIRVGHRHDVAPDIEQSDVQLRIRDDDFDNDAFLSTWRIWEITKLVSQEFERIYRP
jgi:hypothetical protein